MIDVHSHILPLVDDGSGSFSASVSIIKEEIKNGVESIILTPHYKAGRFEVTKEEIEKAFESFKSEIKKLDLNIKLYLGREIYVCDDFYEKLQNNNLITINNTKCVLIEFNFYEETDIFKHVEKIVKLGYVPVIAHIERYTYLDWNILYDLKKLGALIQTNSSCVVGSSGKKIKQIIIEAISQGYVDFVASDIHVNRKSNMKKAYKKISKALGKEIAESVFKLNAQKYFKIGN